jgi:creatinine amidohydrolase/Fe(II)-dependent formamide hydrolase-like protein
MSADNSYEALTTRFLQHDSIRRVSVEVAGEQVTLWTRHGRLREGCTCGAERCEHVLAALHFLLDGTTLAVGAEVRVRSSLRPPPAGIELHALPEAFEELCLATARAGLATPDSPSIKRALDQLLAAAPTPLPLSIARWVGRFQEALSHGESGELARLLDGALRWTEELRTDSATLDAQARRVAWLGTLDHPTTASLADVTLVELAREWLAGVERAAIERRYLIDLAGGELFVEERRRGELEISLGPCPRVAHVAFAELDTATRPQRARLLQYAISMQLTETPWQRVVQLAHTQVTSLRERYAAEVREAPALAEPFVIFAPSQVDGADDGFLRDESGDRVDVRGDHGTPGLEALLAACRGAEIVCVLGRLLGRASGLMLQPLSAIVRRGEWLELRRVT